MLKRGVNILIFYFVLSSSVQAQCCSGGVPISGSLGLTSADANKIYLKLSYDYNVLNDLYNSDLSLEDNSRKRITHSGLLEINYGITKRMTLTGLASFVRQERIIETLPGQRNFNATQGAGDAILMIKYRIISPDKTHGHSLTIGSGPKIPLGKTNFKNNLGLALPADMQPGSGSWDFLFWSVYEKHNFLTENLGISYAFTYRYTGTNRNYFGDQNYRFGNELSFGIQGSYRFLFRSFFFDSDITLRYRSMTEDTFNGNIFPNSGGQFISLIPAINYHINPSITFRTGSYIPLYRKVDGTQLSPSYKFIASISIVIGGKNKHEILDSNKTFKISEQ